MSINIIFEDDSILVLNKPAGIPVYPAKKGKEKTVLSFISAKWPGSMPVHRLDNDTSGLLLVAKDKKSYETLRQQFDEKTVLKKYVALVLGETSAEGTIETPIIHDPRNKKKMKIFSSRWSLPRAKSRGSNNKPQAAHTEYKLLKKYLGGQYSLLEVTIRTGVRHQIRVHFASNGHPLAGDRLYQSMRQRQRDRTGLTRQFLHAKALGFNHPESGKHLDFTSNVPADLQNVLTKLVVA